MAYSYIAAGGRSVCAIGSDDGSPDCWRWGQDGDRPANRYTLYENIPEGEFTMVDVGYGTITCGLKTDGTIDCWYGLDSLDEWYTLPNGGSVIARLSAAPDEATTGYKSVSMDRGSFACGIRNDDTLSCWGWNNQHIGNRMPTDESPWFNSADLLSLELSDGSLNPAFAGDVTTYSASVANSAASIEVTPEVTNLLSTYAITSNTDTSVEDDEVDLTVGENTVTITVTAADGVTTQTYTITVNRQTS